MVKIDNQTEIELTGVEDAKTGKKLEFTETSPYSKHPAKDAKERLNKHPLFNYFYKYRVDENYCIQFRFHFDEDAYQKGMIPTLDADLIYDDNKQRPYSVKEFKKLEHCHHTEQKLDEETHFYIYHFKVTSEDFKNLSIIANDLELNLKITRRMKVKGSLGAVAGLMADAHISNSHIRS